MVILNEISSVTEEIQSIVQLILEVSIISAKFSSCDNSPTRVVLSWGSWLFLVLSLIAEAWYIYIQTFVFLLSIKSYHSGEILPCILLIFFIAADAEDLQHPKVVFTYEALGYLDYSVLSLRSMCGEDSVPRLFLELLWALLIIHAFYKTEAFVFLPQIMKIICWLPLVIGYVLSPRSNLYWSMNI
jgi:hypothetical protein